MQRKVKGRTNIRRKIDENIREMTVGEDEDEEKDWEVTAKMKRGGEW